MKILSGVAIVNDSIGKRLAYTYSEIDAEGNVVRSNVKESFVVIDEEVLSIIEKLESKVKERMA